MNDIRFQILGEKGAEALDKYDEATHRMDNLDVARQMEEAGKDKKAVRLATGWERGRDGKWRYEINDYLQAVSDVYELQGKRKGVVNEKASLFGSKELNKAYPELENVQVKITISDDAKNNGSYENLFINGKKDSSQITVNATDVSKAQSILLHEMQHAIQDIEGLARGGNVNDVALRKKLSLSGVTSLKELREKIKTLESEYKKIYNEWERKAFGKRYKGQKSETSSLLSKWKNIERSIRQLKDNTYDYNDAFSEYQRIAGEVEARNVEKRMDMTPEQRRETLLSETEDVAREDQTVIMDGLEQAMSVSKEGESNDIRFSIDDSGNISNFENKSQQDDTLKRLRKEEEQGRNRSGETNVLASTLLSRLHQATRQKFGNNSKELVEIKASEEKYLEDFAKQIDAWHEPAESGIGNFYDNGQENAVYLDASNTSELTKLNNLNLNSDWLSLLDRIALHNTYFPSTSYTVEGFGRDKNGDFVAILKQPFIQGSPLSQQDIVDYMERRGYELLSKYDENLVGTDEEFKNFIDKKNGIIVEDLHLNNVRKDANENIFVIDPLISLDSPERGYGGNRTANETKFHVEGETDEATQKVLDAITKVMDEHFDKTGQNLSLEEVQERAAKAWNNNSDEAKQFVKQAYDEIGKRLKIAEDTGKPSWSDRLKRFFGKNKKSVIAGKIDNELTKGLMHKLTASFDKMFGEGKVSFQTVPNGDVIMEMAKANADAKFMYNKKGDVLGVTLTDKDGNPFIVLNAEKFNANTLLHEAAGHVMMDWFEQNNPASAVRSY